MNDYSDFLHSSSHPRRISSMATSPFHGIFNTRNHDGKGKSIFSFGQPEPESAPSPLVHAPQEQVGRVAVDIYEQDEYYIIKAPIAGVKLSDLDIEVNDNVVTIRGERRQGDEVPGGQYLLQECFWGPFSRSVTLPTPVDPRKIRATFNKECILKIIIPKEEKVKIVRITEV